MCKIQGEECNARASVLKEHVKLILRNVVDPLDQLELIDSLQGLIAWVTILKKKSNVPWKRYTIVIQQKMTSGKTISMLLLLNLGFSDNMGIICPQKSSGDILEKKGSKNLMQQI
ncbi:hypothetical protein ACET3Z_003933 [Daucus carota]